MSNPFFNAMGGGNRVPGPMGNMMQMMQQFRQFKNTFQGDPKAEIEKMIREGKISQEQLNRAQQMAQQIAPYMK